MRCSLAEKGVPMTDRERLLEILNKPIFHHEMVDPLEAVADYLLDNGVTFQKWIPVTEQLPEANKKVIVLLASKIEVIAILRQNVWLVSWNHAPLNHVTHWMPLPELTKEDGR